MGLLVPESHQSPSSPLVGCRNGPGEQTMQTIGIPEAKWQTRAQHLSHANLPLLPPLMDIPLFSWNGLLHPSSQLRQRLLSSGNSESKNRRTSTEGGFRTPNKSAAKLRGNSGLWHREDAFDLEKKRLKRMEHTENSFNFSEDKIPPGTGTGVVSLARCHDGPCCSETPHRKVVCSSPLCSDLTMEIKFPVRAFHLLLFVL